MTQMAADWMGAGVAFILTVLESGRFGCVACAGGWRIGASTLFRGARMLRSSFCGFMAVVVVVFGGGGWALGQDPAAASQPALEDVGPTLVTLKLATPEPGAV